MSEENGWSIGDAGQVLAGPFLPCLFSMLNLSTESGFVDSMAAERAVRLLQFMVYGESQTDDSGLVLGKVLCGIDPGRQLSSAGELSGHERNTVEQMLHGMRQNWTAMGSTSLEGLRQSFLQRQGWLSRQEECWHLRVEARAYDVLLDRLPWRLGPIHYGWMDRPLRVAWRDA